MRNKIIASFLVICSLGLASAQESGFFVGVNAGVPITTPSYSGFLSTIDNNLPTIGVGWALGVNVGYQQALSPSFGLKYYVDYNYNESYGDKKGGNFAGISKVKADLTQQQITANVDFYYNLTSAFAAYLGLGIGYQSYKPTWKPTIPFLGEMSFGGKQKGGLAVPLNLGVTYDITSAHSVLLGAKIPLVKYDYDTEVSLPPMPAQSATSSMRTYLVQVGYRFKF